MECFAVHKEDKSKTVCLICNKKVSWGVSNLKNFNATNLRKYLQSHSDKNKKFCEKEATKQKETRAVNAHASVQASLKQITLQGLEERRKPFSPDHPHAKELTYRAAEIIAIDLQPFSIVEDVGFASW